MSGHNGTANTYYNFVSLIGAGSQKSSAQTLANVAQINEDTAVLLEERDEQVKTLHVLNAAYESKKAARMFLFLLTSRIKFAQKRLDETQEQIDFNIAYCDLEPSILAGVL